MPVGARTRGPSCERGRRLCGVSAVDADLAVSRARFTDAAPVGSEVPGAVETAASSMASSGACFETARVARDLFNLLNTRDSDIDYYYTSRLPDEPLGAIDDIHLHPALPRSARGAFTVGY